MENTIIFKDKDYIFKEGEPADYVFQIIRGNVSLSFRNEFVEKLKIGDYIGIENISVGKNTYRYTARSEGKTELRPIFYADFLEKIKNDEKTALYVSQRVTTSSPLVKKESPSPRQNDNPKEKSKSLHEKVNFNNLGITHNIIKVETASPTTIENDPGKKRNIVSGIFKEKPENEVFTEKEDFMILVSKIEGDETGACKEWILAALKNMPKSKIYGIENEISIKMPIVHETATAKNLVTSFKADCLIWGGLDDNGQLMELHFTSAEDPYYNDGLGFSAINPVYIPLNGGNEYYRILRSSCLGATSARTKTQCENLSLLLEDALMKAHILIENNRGLSSREHACNLIAYANSCFKKGFFDRRGIKYLNEAVSIYGLALHLLPDNDTKTAAFANHQLGRIYSIKAAKSKNPDDCKKAISFFENAAQSTPKEITPFLWANINFKLGELFFKIAVKEGIEEYYRKAIAALNGCASVYTVETDAQHWAEIANFTAKILFTHGEEYKNIEEINRGIAMCESALSIRTKDEFPILWANTTVNMASGLFLAGKNQKDTGIIMQAKRRFNEARDIYDKLALHAQKTTADKNISIIDNYLDELEKDAEFIRHQKSKKQTIFDALAGIDISLARDDTYENDDERRDIGEY